MSNSRRAGPAGCGVRSTVSKCDDALAGIGLQGSSHVRRPMLVTSGPADLGGHRSVTSGDIIANAVHSARRSTHGSSSDSRGPAVHSARRSTHGSSSDSRGPAVHSARRSTHGSSSDSRGPAGPAASVPVSRMVNVEPSEPSHSERKSKFPGNSSPTKV